MIRKILVCAALAALSAAPAAAVDFSFTGNFVNDDDVALFNFVVGAPSTVTLVTYSFAGGTNAAGQIIAAGGFDPILSIYDSSGVAIAFNDDGDAGTVPVDAATGRAFDTFFQQTLGVGSYTVAVTQFDNFGGATLSDPFQRAGQTTFTGTDCSSPGSRFLVTGFLDCSQRTSAWAFDILNVASAVGPGIPEPASWTLMIAGFGIVGGAMRYRTRAVA